MDPFIQYAVAAAEFAVGDAASRRTPADRTGAASTSAPASAASATIEEYRIPSCSRRARTASRPSSSISTIINEAAGQVSIRYGAKGPNSGHRSRPAPRDATASATPPRIIARGDADIMIAGGAEATITPLGVAGFCAMKALSAAQRRPGAGLAARSTRTATASSWARAPASSSSRSSEHARKRGAQHLRRDRRLRLHRRRLPRHRARRTAKAPSAP